MTSENFGFVPDAPSTDSPSNNFGFIPDAAPSAPSLLQKVASSPGVQATLGAGDALRNTIASGINMLTTQPSGAQKSAVTGMIGGLPLPQTQNIPSVSPVNSGNGGLAYSLGNIAGNTLGFMGGGEILDAARVATEGAPVIGGIASALGGNGLSGVARRAIGSGLYGAVSNQNNRVSNAGIGAGLSVATDAIPGIAGLGASASEYFQPQKYSQKIIQGLSGGQNMQDATKSVLAAVKNSYEAQKGNASDLYDSVRDNIPSGSIYAPISEKDTAIFGTPNKQGAYQNLPDNITDNYTSTLQDMHNNFINNPTFANAHSLQSELGATTRQLQSGIQPQTIGSLNSINALNSARGALKSDMNTFLGQQSPELQQSYKDASDYFQDNVVPYRTNPKIFSIAQGEMTNVKPTSLANIFAAPDEDMDKVISDLPEGTMDKVLYTKLGQTTPSTNPITLMRQSQRLNEQGLGQYISPNLAQQLGSLENRIKARSSLQSAAGAMLGAAGGGEHGTAGAVGMGLAGGALGSPLMNYLSRRLPLDKVGSAISNVLRGTYPIGRSAYIANKLNNSGVNQ